MAQSFTAPGFGTVYAPGTYFQSIVQTSASGTPTTGVLMLVGEADAGPDVTSDPVDVTQNFFGPDQLASVVAKYKSGPIVDAFRIATAASNDPNIQGSFTRAYIGKTNVSSKASGALSRSGLTNWATLADRGYGSLTGNQTNASVTANVAEVAPTTGQFTYIPSPNSSTLSVRVNGQAQQNCAISAKTAPNTLVGTVESTAGQSLNSLTISGLNTTSATGGQNRSVLAVAGSIGLVASGNNVVITITTAWTNNPSVGDTLLIPLTGEYGAAGDSVLKGAASANAGAYVITAVTNTTISATKLRNNVTGALVPPVTVASTPVLAVTDILAYSPITLNNYSGTERVILTGLTGDTITGTASGQTLTLTLQTGAVWAAVPQAGDLILMPVTAPSAWRASNTNGGWYQVVSATSNPAAGGSTIVMTRLSNGAPVSFSATAIAAVTDLRCLRPVIDGTGKALSISDGGGTESISSPGMFYNLSTTAVTWISSAQAPVLLTSASEYVAQLNINRALDNVNETWVGNGDVVLKVGYSGGGLATTATLTISGTTLTTTVSGGTGQNLSVDLKQFTTLGALATYLNSQTGYSASVASALYGQNALIYTDNSGTKQTILDKGTFGICSSLGSQPGLLKKSAYYLFSKLAGGSITQLGATTELAPTAGQPEVQSLFFLSGGAKGYTTNARVDAAIDAMQKVRGNFLVPLFSQDATADIALGLTDASSTYTVDAINAYALSHVLAMSVPRIARYRQAFLSKKGSFAQAKIAANNIASARCSMAFQDFKAVDTSGNITQFQPWATAVDAAAMQAAGFYKAITKKFINTQGILMADGSFSANSPSQVDDALQNGLLFAEQVDTGGYRWVDDQTTYAVDNNFVYNSIQAVYAIDIIAQTISQVMTAKCVGQSLADISPGLMLSILDSVMKQLKSLKLIASSDGAEAGYKGAIVSIAGPVATINVQVFLATELLFVPVTAYVNQVTQSASQ